MAWLDRLEMEIDNLRMALERAAQTHNVWAGAQLVHGLWWLWFVRGYVQEGQRWAVTVLPDERTEQAPAARAIAHHAVGWLLVRQGYHRQGFQHFTVALPAARQTADDRLIADVTRALGNSSAGEESIQLLNEALRLHSACLAHYDMAITAMLLGMHLRAMRRVQEAAARFQTALDLLRPLQERWGMAQILYRLSLLAMDNDDNGQAYTLLEQSTRLLRELRDPVGSADNLCILTMLALRRKDDGGALAALKEAVVLFNNVGHLDRIGQCLELGASYVHDHGDLTRTAVLLGAADAVWRQSGQHFRPDPNVDAEFYRLVPLVRAELAARDFASAWAVGQQMTTQQMVAAVLALA